MTLLITILMFELNLFLRILNTCVVYNVTKIGQNVISTLGIIYNSIVNGSFLMVMYKDIYLLNRKTHNKNTTLSSFPLLSMLQHNWINHS